MAERLDETDDGFLGAQTSENLDMPTIPLPSDVSTPPNDQIEVNAVAGNETGGPAVLPVLKKMTPVGCLNEICVVMKLSIPQYESKGEVGVAHMKVFTTRVWVPDMNLRGTGHGKTKIEAKNEAATRILDKLRADGERNESLSRLTPEVVKKCHEMLKKFFLPEPQSDLRPLILINKQGPCPVCKSTITKKQRAELSCGHVFCKLCVQLWADHLILHGKTQIFCMELSCGLVFHSFWTYQGEKSVFDPVEGFLPPTFSRQEIRRQQLLNRLRDVELRLLKNQRALNEPADVQNIAEDGQ